jgi:outer membrane lipoprotein LolB
MRAFGGAATQAIGRTACAVQSLAVAALLSACVPTQMAPSPAEVVLPPAQTAFDVAGRMSVRHGSTGLAASFRWAHTGERDELTLASPLGQTVANLSGDASQVRLQAADGQVSTADGWDALTERGLGWPLPVQGLAFWIQGSARPGAPFSVEAGGDGRAAVLRQDGWTIVYQAYTPDAENPRPTRLTLTYPDVELRIAIDRWQ